ncbi:hypothetical protein DITRI_Ditri20bG0050700 [Diplodiscus trichospermus]
MSRRRWQRAVDKSQLELDDAPYRYADSYLWQSATPLKRHFEYYFACSNQDVPNVLEIVGAELARKKTETTRMARQLRAKKTAVKRKKNEIHRIKRMNKLLFAVNRRKQKMIEDFLLAAEAENSDPETAKIQGMIQGMNDLKLEGINGRHNQ